MEPLKSLAHILVIEVTTNTTTTTYFLFPHYFNLSPSLSLCHRIKSFIDAYSFLYFCPLPIESYLG